MCGIAGLLNAGRSANQDVESTERMLGALVHRGPDGHGLWQDPDAGITLGHRRLSIVDLSPLGTQPMHSVDQRFSLVFNGEIYNFKALRQLLEQQFQHRFRGHSDTEVLLEAFAYWGIEKTLNSINGMFALALWDHQQRLLHLMRDRLGEKPLIYGLINQSLVFASEVRAISRIPGLDLNIDPQAVSTMLHFSNVPAPATIYRELRKLPPGMILSVRAEDLANGQLPATRPYWSTREAFERGSMSRFTGSEEQAVTQLDALLREATALRMEADVPLGAFLSGGVDSTLTCALMQAQSASPIQTFTVGFADAKYDESAFAKQIAGHLKTRHTELFVTDHEILEAVPKMARVFDEPFSDSSQVPTFLISQLTRKHVTVALSGDGGDELFGGYNRYATAMRLLAQGAWLPATARDGLARLLTLTGPDNAKVRKLAGALQAEDLEHFYAQLLSQWHGRDNPAQVPALLPGIFASENPTLNDPDPLRKMMYWDCMHYLPDDILVKVDRAAMAASLETRIPLLDHRVLEFSARVPVALLRKKGRGKYILRKLLERYVPPTLFDRPKMGFSAPISTWLKGPLRPWAESLLQEDRLNREGHLNTQVVRARWQQHLQGRESAAEIWSVLMFQSWLEEKKENA